MQFKQQQHICTKLSVALWVVGNLRALPSSPWVNSSHHSPPTPQRRQLYLNFEKKQEWYGNCQPSRCMRCQARAS